MVIIGKCEDMCPKSEIEMRYKEGLLHVLEIKYGTEKLIRPLPDSEKMVKSFSRSAAGKQINSNDLRTPKALQRTVNYLLYEVAENQMISWNKTYDFITDRLLAVRQEMVIQDVPRSYCVSLLQPMIKFYVYSAYRLCELPISEFDPILNKKHLQECLKRLLVLYDEYDFLQEKIQNVNISYKKEDFEILFRDCREFFEALYILFNLGDVESIFRGLKFGEKKWRTNLVKTALKISFCYKNGNWVRFCRMIIKLPPLLAGIVSLHLPELRRKTLEKMSVAYSSKNLSYPIEILQKELLYSNKIDLINDCLHYGIKCSEKEIKFMKSDFDKIAKVVSPRREQFLIDKFTNIKPSVTLDSCSF